MGCVRSSEKAALGLLLHRLLEQLAALVSLVKLLGDLHRHADLLGKLLGVRGGGHEAGLFGGLARHDFLFLILSFLVLIVRGKSCGAQPECCQHCRVDSSCLRFS